jgi:hypothetical protein
MLAPSKRISALPPTFTDGFGSIPAGTSFVPGVVTGSWLPVWNGYGAITRTTDGSPVATLSPAASLSADVTHSSLVVSVPTFADTDLTMTLRTVGQLRSGTPNPWEVGWAMWHYSDQGHFYYVLLKPTGWELGKEDPAYPGSQRFMATGSNQTFAVGVWHTVRVVQIGNALTVWADGAQLTSFVDNERPYLSGSIGLYCEDSTVNFGPLSARAPAGA